MIQKQGLLYQSPQTANGLRVTPPDRGRLHP